MAHVIDPEGVETRAIHDLVDFDGARVLEVGCGDGRLTWRYAERTASVLAVDLNAEKIEIAKRETPAPLRGKVSFAVEDMTAANLPENSYDVGILSYSL